MAKKIPISLQPSSVMTVSRTRLENSRTVYVMLASKQLSYSFGKSRIAYIGTTQNGLNRVAESAAERAEQILSEHGVQSFDVRLVTCRQRQKVKSWQMLERAMLLEFRCLYGQVPLCNDSGKKMKIVKEFEYFSQDRVRKIIEKLGNL